MGLFAPRGASDALIDAINKAVNEVLLQPEVKAGLLDKGVTATPLSVGQFRAFVAAETSRYATLIDTEFARRVPGEATVRVIF